MAEYILKTAAMEIVRRTSGDYAAAFAAIRKLPAADVAPVVRCKDCWYSGFDPEYGKRWCERCWGSMLVQDDDFCSYGEKREDRHE